jgi:predicted dehydrogenase
MSRIKIGIVGCGAIAQVQHMPNLHDLQGRFEVTWVCDVSTGAAQYVANKYKVPNHTTDYNELLDGDVEAVLLCHRDPKTKIALACLQMGKHTFIEKPVCFSKEEAQSITDAAGESGVLAQTGYMKVYDPAFELATEATRGWDPTFIQVNHLHPNNNLHMSQFHIERFDDVPPETGVASQRARDAAFKQAMGDNVPSQAQRIFFTLSGSMIHDLYGLRMLFGNPSRIVSTDAWKDGRAVTTNLEYPSGARCVASWVDLPDLWDFKETLEVYGDDRRVILTYPTGFSRGQLSHLTLQRIDSNGRTISEEPAIDWASPFVRELEHFYDCIVNGTSCRTPIADARHDIQLVINITQSYVSGAPVVFGE